MKTGAEETGDVDVVWRGGGGGGVYDFLYERAYLPQPFSERPCTSMYVGSNFSTKPDCVYASSTVPV